MAVKSYFLSVVSVAMLAGSQAVLAGPVIIDGVQYNNEEQARQAIQKSIQVRLEQVPQDYLKSVNVIPLGGRFVVNLPSVEEARLKYVWVTGGIFKPSRETQNLVAESIIANIKIRFLTFKKVGFIDDVFFIESGNSITDSIDYDYIVSFAAEFDGQRTPQSVQFRKTEWIMQPYAGGPKQLVVTSYGAPASVNDLAALSGLRNAVQALKTAGQMVDVTKSIAAPSQSQTITPNSASLGLSVAASAAAASAVTAATAIPKQQPEPEVKVDSKGVQSERQEVSFEDVILERALSRCTNIGFKRDTTEFRSCVTEQIKILSK